jgi:hypothetical protein
MKKILLALAAAATIAAASAAPASALTIIKPIGGGIGYPNGGFGGGISVGVGVVDPGFSAGYYGGCYTTYRKVLIPNIGIVLKKQVVCG